MFRVECLALSGPPIVGDSGIHGIHPLGMLLQVLHQLIVQAVDFRVLKQKVLPVAHELWVPHARPAEQCELLNELLRGKLRWPLNRFDVSQP